MDLWVDLPERTDEEETEDSAYEPGWYSVLKELSLVATPVGARRRI
jgi:hypothetical protein